MQCFWLLACHWEALLGLAALLSIESIRPIGRIHVTDNLVMPRQRGDNFSPSFWALLGRNVGARDVVVSQGSERGG